MSWVISICASLFLLVLGYVFVFPIVKSKFVSLYGIEYISKRNDYIWNHRKKFPRIVTLIMDYIFIVDTEWADRNAWTHPKDSIKIEHASLFTWSKCLDVTEKLQEQVRQFKKFEEQKTISVNCLDERCYGTWTLDVSYTGHSNKNKQTAGSQYTVRYTGNTDITGNAFRFPPYGVSEVQKKGLGSVKVKKAVDPSGTDITDLAKMASGLKGNFYVDLDSTSKVIHKFMMMPGSKITMTNGDEFVSE